MSAGPAQLRTTSLRLRTVVAIVVLLAVLLAGLGIAVQAVLGDRLRAQTADRLRDRAAAAAALVGTVGADDLADRLSAQGLSVRIVQPDGAEVLAGPTPAELRAGPPDPAGLPAPGPVGASGRSGSGTRTGSDATGADGAASGTRVVASRTTEDDGVLTLVSRLQDGTVLTLTAGTRDVQSTLATLGWVMAAASTAFLVVAVVGVTLVVRRSLRPLDVMTATATSIAAGDRGRRLRPHRHDTEIGRAAVAIDSMLDAVEGAEDQAVAAETRLRAFLSDAAHELRTPVAGVRAAAETLVRAGVGPDQERLAVHVVRQAGRASRLVDDMLMTARLDRGIDLDRSAVELGGFLRTEVERLALRRPSLDVRLVTAGEDVTALVDADRVAQVVGNVADNAARATGGTGRLLVTLATADDGATAVVRVEDDGPGIATADRDRVFDRLVRLRAAREDDGAGAGLGLPIARGLARAHGGDLVAVDPVVLDGAAFVLTVPCLPGHVSAPPARVTADVLFPDGPAADRGPADGDTSDGAALAGSAADRRAGGRDGGGVPSTSPAA